MKNVLSVRNLLRSKLVLGLLLAFGSAMIAVPVYAHYIYEDGFTYSSSYGCTWNRAEIFSRQRWWLLQVRRQIQKGSRNPVRHLLLLGQPQSADRSPESQVEAVQIERFVVATVHIHRLFLQSH